MKLFTALAALTLIAAPVVAAPSTDQLEQAKQIVSSSLEAAKQGDWSTACSRYKAYQNYRQQTGQTVFIPVNGQTLKLRDLQHGNNEVTAQINATANDSGKFLCGKAGVTWSHLNLDTTYSRFSQVTGPVTKVSSVSQNIRNRCEKEWGTDYRMVKYCIDKQTNAARSLGY